MTEPRPVFPLGPASATSAAALSGVLYWLAFPGVDAWPLAFVAFVPLLLALRGQTPKRALVLGLASGLVMNLAGFYWLFVMLRSFSGFPTALCLLLVLVICTYQGGRIAFMGWLYARGAQRGWPHAFVALGAFAASELIFPLLFPWSCGATVYEVHALVQVAELGGPILVGVMLLGVGVAIEELIHSRLTRRITDRGLVLAGFGGLAVAALFGYIRIPQVDARAQVAEPLRVGIVQANMGLMAKREQAREGLSRHRSMTADLTRRGVDLVVWSESAVSLSVPEGTYSALYRANVTQGLGVQTIFGGIISRGDPDPKRRTYFNSALISDTAGTITGRYDKEHLLYFGETLPFETTLPILRAWSPNSGRYSSGTGLDPLPFETTTGRHSASVLICYEDVLPAFTNRMVRHAHPDLLVNITNDAWFGNTSELWEHLALATFRSIEHRRYLVRSTNSGISAFVDPVGRIMVQSHPFRSENIDAVVHLMRERTVYELLGDAPAWTLTAMTLVFAFRRRRRPGD